MSYKQIWLILLAVCVFLCEVLCLYFVQIAHVSVQSVSCILMDAYLCKALYVFICIILLSNEFVQVYGMHLHHHKQQQQLSLSIITA